MNYCCLRATWKTFCTAASSITETNQCNAKKANDSRAANYVMFSSKRFIAKAVCHICTCENLSFTGWMQPWMEYQVTTCQGRVIGRKLSLRLPLHLRPIGFWDPPRVPWPSRVKRTGSLSPEPVRWDTNTANSFLSIVTKRKLLKTIKYFFMLQKRCFLECVGSVLQRSCCSAWLFSAISDAVFYF